MLGIAPLLPAPNNGIAATLDWDVFSAFDSVHYEKVAIQGYGYSVINQDYSVVFFPLFPLILRGLIILGLPFKLAGTLLNNLAFLWSLIVLFSWINNCYGIKVARWVLAVMTFFPMSLFGTVIYTEGLYLLLSTATLKAFDQRKYVQMAIWGAMATATRPTGIALILSLLIVSFKESRGIKAYIFSLASGIGIFLYSIYCQIKFGDFLAFVHAQKAWRTELGFRWQSWLKILMQIIIGPVNVKSGYIKDPWYPLLFLSLIIIAYLLWYFRKRLGSLKVDYAFFILILLAWLLAGDPLINVGIVLGGGYLLWHLRSQLLSIIFVYGCCGLGLIFASGGTISMNRIAYGIVSLSIALGMLLSRYSRWGYAAMAFFTILLITFSIRFSQNLWVA
ncbi:hypothetical protein CV014_15865 [Nostoc sp. CMAA1605]|nr:hypothetical protein [Nostoc sp. CMAA1605]